MTFEPEFDENMMAEVSPECFMEETELFPNVPVSSAEQEEIVRVCNAFKHAAQAHARQKKETMRDCYAYTKGKFVGNDLLPTPSTLGSDKDAESNRPQIFIPVIRQQVKAIYSQLKMTLFPNDEDYFRVRGKNEEAAAYEDALTEGLKYLFKEALLTEKIGTFLLDLIWAGNGAIFPTIRDDMVWEWQFDPMMRSYVPVQVDLPPTPDLEVLNPLNFYIDPHCQDPDRAKWCYVGKKKCQEIQDSHLYFNKEKLGMLAKKNVQDTGRQHALGLSGLNDLNNSFEDVEWSIDYDLYYFPYLKTETREYRNMLVGVVGEQVLIRFHPNLYPRGLNPVVFCTWMQDSETPYGVGPVEDIKELQRLINIVYNYMVEVLARIGNRFVAREGTDISNLFGVAGGIVYTQDTNDFRPLTGDYAEPQALMNLIGVLKAEAQITAGSQNPFQGSSNIDFRKTATELQILQENSITILREVIEHISIMGVQRVLERLMYLAADLYQSPIMIRVDDPLAGTRFVPVDFQMLRSGLYTIELVGVNPSQSKQAQVNSLIQLLNLGLQNENFGVFLRNNGFEVVKKIAILQGIKDYDSLLNSPAQVQANKANAQPPIPPGMPLPPGMMPDLNLGGLSDGP